MRVLKILGWGIAGILVLLVLLTVVTVGVAGGAYWYFSRNPDLRATVTYPVNDKEVVINLFTEEGLPQEEKQKVLEEGTFQGRVQLSAGPFNFKLVGLRIGVDIPIDELLDIVTEEMDED